MDRDTEEFMVQVPTFPTRSTTSSSIVGEQQDELYDTRVRFWFAGSGLVVMVPFPSLRLTRSTPLSSVTRAEKVHMYELQFTEQLDGKLRRLQATEQLDCDLRSLHTGAEKSVTCQVQTVHVFYNVFNNNTVGNREILY